MRPCSGLRTVPSSERPASRDASTRISSRSSSSNSKSSTKRSSARSGTKGTTHLLPDRFVNRANQHSVEMAEIERAGELADRFARAGGRQRAELPGAGHGNHPASTNQESENQRCGSPATGCENHHHDNGPEARRKDEPSGQLLPRAPARAPPSLVHDAFGTRAHRNVVSFQEARYGVTATIRITMTEWKHLRRVARGLSQFRWLTEGASTMDRVSISPASLGSLRFLPSLRRKSDSRAWQLYPKKTRSTSRPCRGGIPVRGIRGGRCLRASPRGEQDSRSLPHFAGPPRQGASQAADSSHIPGTKRKAR